MSTGFLRRPRFLLERWVQRGVLHQLLLMAGLVLLVAVVGGLAAWAASSKFETPSEAIWWSFLRLTDPGYLGDDEGLALRAVSTVVTVLGYVLFMGSLIAILTQWLARTIRSLERGLTPIAMKHHFVILGWSNRTPEIIKKLVTAGGRLERFLGGRAGAHKLQVVVLADDVDAERRLQLREELGEDWDESQVFLRSGSSLQREHLERLDLPRAAVVIIPGADFELGGAELSDTRVVKTLLTLDALLKQGAVAEPPQIVAELFDPRKVPIARSSIASGTELIAGDRLISRILSQSLRHPGVAPLLIRLMTHREGNALYLRAFPELVGSSPRALFQAFPEAVVLGSVSMSRGAPTVHLAPADDVVLGEGDLLILLAERYDRCLPAPADRRAVAPAASGPPLPAREPQRRRVLILGWSYKIPTLLAELMEANEGGFDVTILSKMSVLERTRALAHIELNERVRVEQVEGDYSLVHDLERVEPRRFGHVLLMASGWMQSSEEADARTVLGFLLLRSLLQGHQPKPEILAELLDPSNARILGDATEAVFVSPRLLSHLLAHVGLRPELNAVYDALICASGAEIELRMARELGLATDQATFADVQVAAASRGCVGLGLVVALASGAPPEVVLNPPRDRRFRMTADVQIILLSRHGPEASGSEPVSSS